MQGPPALSWEDEEMDPTHSSHTSSEMSFCEQGWLAVVPTECLAHSRCSVMPEWEMSG